MELRPNCILRPYQEKSLRHMFSNGRARSGIIVLPCGAGKTLTGVAACCTVDKPAIVLCTSNVAVEQWEKEFQRWSTVKRGQICQFTTKSRTIPKGPAIIVSTYVNAHTMPGLRCCL